MIAAPQDSATLESDAINSMLSVANHLKMVVAVRFTGKKESPVNVPRCVKGRRNGGYRYLNYATYN